MPIREEEKALFRDLAIYFDLTLCASKLNELMQAKYLCSHCASRLNEFVLGSAMNSKFSWLKVQVLAKEKKNQDSCSMEYEPLSTGSNSSVFGDSVSQSVISLPRFKVTRFQQV